MTKYYCKCLNICITIEQNDGTFFKDQNLLSEEEKEDDFFRKLPLILVHFCEIHKQQSALIQANPVGSWTRYRCLNCNMYTHAHCRKEDNSTTTLINKLLHQLDADQIQEMKETTDFSPVFNIIVTDFLSLTDCLQTSQLLEEFSNVHVIELRNQLTEKIEEQTRNTDEIIRKFVEQRKTALKQYITRANDDFQVLKNAVLSHSMDRLEKKSSNTTTESIPVKPSEPSVNSVISDDLVIASAFNEKSCDRNTSFSSTLPVSLDSEGLFALDGMEESNILEDEDHSEEDLSDTDDSGSRDEGIHIPRRRSIAIARSLPIRVRADFDPSLRLFDERLNDNKGKPNYKQKPRHERPVDIAASMKALANSVHGDTIFGDLPPPRIGSRI